MFTKFHLCNAVEIRLKKSLSPEINSIILYICRSPLCYGGISLSLGLLTPQNQRATNTDMLLRSASSRRNTSFST